MSLIDAMYQGGDLPASTKPEKVKVIHDHLTARLQEEMEKRHVWLASCTVAVEAGRWRGNRFRKRRRKLLVLINKCRTFLDVPVVELARGWENVNIIDGYGAHQQWMSQTGASLESSLSLANFILGPNKINDGGDFEVPSTLEFHDIIAQTIDPDFEPE
tara:strand:+ start:558 stop:1034 length:477 start_codon:yes stop_codon:yes gene_type:complete